MYYRHRHWNNLQPRKTAAQKLDSKYRGANTLIIRFFYSLSEFQLKLLFAKYERHFGKEKRKYAEDAYPHWKRGTKGTSTETVERLIKLVPQVLSTADRYSIIKKLWSGFRVRETIRISMHPNSCNDLLVETLTERILRGTTVRIPESLNETLTWLYDEDSIAIKMTLESLEMEDAVLVTNALLMRVDEIKKAAQKADGLDFCSYVSLALPFANITIEISNSKALKTMSENPRDDLSKKDGQIVPQNDQKPVIIQNPGDLLGDALKLLPQKKAEELMGKASEEALRLQVKQKEIQIDREAFKVNIDNVVGGAQRAAEDKNIEFEVKHEQTSAHGRSTVHVKTVPQQPPQQESKFGMKCFIATVCYDDMYHPDLDSLRKFRDSVLVKTSAGQNFVVWYYRNGEMLAQKLRSSAFSRRAVKMLLSSFVRLYRALS